MSEGVDDPNLEAQGELSMARLALDDGEITHAATHIANAFTCTPDEPVMREAIAALADLRGLTDAGPTDLYPPRDPESLGAAIARAHLFGLTGRTAEAVALLFSVARYAPGAAWAAADWFDVEDLPRHLDPDELTTLLIGLGQAVPDPLSDEQRMNLLPFVRFAGRCAVAYPDAGKLIGAASVVSRRCGHTDEAIRLARLATEVEPSLLTETFLANALRSAGRLDEALAAMRRAADHDPSFLAIHADLATLLDQMGQLDAAIAHAEQASAVNPEYDCIVYTLGALRYKRDNNIDHLVSLCDYSRGRPDDNACSHDEVASSCSGQPWLGFVPDAAEAITNVLEQVLDKEDIGRTSEFGITLSDLEVPSAISIVRRVLPKMNLTISATSEPDIRLPVRETGRPLWSYEGMVGRPAVARPDQAVVQAVDKLAQRWLGSPIQAYDRAVVLAGIPIEELVRCAVHCTMDGVFAFDDEALRYPAWQARAIQVWACLGILHQRTDEAWASSSRRQALADIVYGQEDWTTEAATYALVAGAWADPSIRADVVNLVGFRFLDAVKISRERVVTIRESLARLALCTPDMNADLAALARDILAAADTETH